MFILNFVIFKKSKSTLLFSSFWLTIPYFSHSILSFKSVTARSSGREISSHKLNHSFKMGFKKYVGRWPNRRCYTFLGDFVEDPFGSWPFSPWVETWVNWGKAELALLWNVWERTTLLIAKIISTLLTFGYMPILFKVLAVSSSFSCLLYYCIFFSMCKLMVCTEHGSKWTDSGDSATKMLHLIRVFELITAISHRSK